MKFKNILLLFLVFILTFSLSYLLRNSDFIKELFSSTTTLKFQKYTYDFGNIIANKEVRTYFFYKNTGKNFLKIKNIVSSCGCTITVWSRKKLRPNFKDSILVKYDAKTIGYFSKAIYVFSNTESSPDCLFIKGTVK